MFTFTTFFKKRLVQKKTKEMIISNPIGIKPRQPDSDNDSDKIELFDYSSIYSEFSLYNE
jgi:hypothetical protein